MKRLAATICVSPKAFDKNNIAKDQTMQFRPRRPPKDALPTQRKLHFAQDVRACRQCRGRLKRLPLVTVARTKPSHDPFLNQKWPSGPTLSSLLAGLRMKTAVSLEAVALFRALKDEKSKFAKDCRQIVLSEAP